MEEEDNCQCEEGFLSCGSCNGCFSIEERCDGTVQCANGRDEEFCNCQFNNDIKKVSFHIQCKFCLLLIHKPRLWIELFVQHSHRYEKL